MNEFWHYQGNTLYGGDANLLTVAQQFGTPCYVYSQVLIEQQWNAYKKALQAHPHHLCYAVKANSNLAILQLLAKLGAGFDIVSGGELKRVLRAGGDPAKVVFSGVGKTVAEIAEALAANIQCFNVESIAELDRIQQVAQQQQKIASIALRINPNINAQTHPYISTGLKENKFGINIKEAIAAYHYAKQLPNIKIAGVDCHIGSQITQLDPFVAAWESLFELIDALAHEGIVIQHLDLGGGLGVSYNQETPPAPAEYIESLLTHLQGRKLTISLEPGRSIIAHAGILLTQVEFIKKADKNFAIVDAGMNDLIRPALYGAWQTIVPVQINPNATEMLYDVVGPVCESADFLGKERTLAIAAGDYLAVKDAGAYGFVMSSQYNSRPRPPEILLTAQGPQLVRARESYDDLWQGEKLL